MSNYKNLRGIAVRDRNKSVRVATHSHVLKSLLDEVKCHVTVLEHGMGISSTPLLHSHKNVSSFVSFEDDPSWARCSGCTGNHEIFPYSPAQAKKIIEETHPYLVFLDGPGLQRNELFEICLKLNVHVIVEHDSETHDENAVEFRRRLLKEHGYIGVVDTSKNPETAIYVKDAGLIKNLQLPHTTY